MQTTNSQLIRLPEVMRRTGMSRAWIYQAVADGRFIRFYKVGRSSLWHAAAVDSWIADRLQGVALVTKAA